MIPAIEVRQPRASKEGTIPVMIKLEQDEEPSPGQTIRYRLQYGPDWWSPVRTGMVEQRNVDGYLFIVRGDP